MPSSHELMRLKQRGHAASLIANTVEYVDLHNVFTLAHPDIQLRGPGVGIIERLYVHDSDPFVWAELHVNHRARLALMRNLVYGSGAAWDQAQSELPNISRVLQETVGLVTPERAQDQAENPLRWKEHDPSDDLTDPDDPIQVALAARDYAVDSMIKSAAKCFRALARGNTVEADDAALAAAEWATSREGVASVLEADTTLRDYVVAAVSHSRRAIDHLVASHSSAWNVAQKSVEFTGAGPSVTDR